MQNKNKKSKNNFYMRAKKIVAGPIRFFNRIKVFGAENVPNEGGYILCSNHIAAKDVLLLGASCPRQLRFIAKKELFKIPILSQIMTLLGAVKIDRQGNDIGAIRKSIDIINSGELIAIFPQGHRYPAVDPGITQVKSGVSMIAYRSKCDIIPAFIETKDNKYRLFQRINIYFGEPIPHNMLELDNAGKESYDNTAKLIFSKVIELGGYTMSPTQEKNDSEDAQ